MNCEFYFGSGFSKRSYPASSSLRLLRLFVEAFLCYDCSLVFADAGVVAWGTGSQGQTNVPAGLTDVVAVAVSPSDCVALARGGRVTAWGDNALGQTNVPADVTNATAIAATSQQSLAVRSSGSVVKWTGGAAPPATLTNATLVGGGAFDALALRADGTLVAWGNNILHGETSIPPPATNIVAISSGTYHNLALRTDGLVFAWGDNSAGQCNVPAGLSNVVAIAAGYYNSLALTRDGSIVAWGDNVYGESSVPPGLSNIVALGASGFASLALSREGTIRGWGDNSYGQISIPDGLTNVVEIAPGVAYFCLALVGEGLPIVTAQPLSLTSYSGAPVELQARAAGGPPLTYQWRFNASDIPGATNAFLFLDSASRSNAGDYVLTVSNSLGTTNSSTAHLTIVDSAPRFLRTLTNQSAYPGKLVTLQVVAVGSAPLSYHWQFNGADIAGATGSTFSFAATPSSGGQYAVIASNPFGAVTNGITITVPLALQWASQDFLPIMYAIPDTNLVSVLTGIPNAAQQDTGVRRDGTVTNWDVLGHSPGGLPGSLTNVLAAAGGVEHFLAVRSDGTVVAWGGNTFGETSVPAGLDNVVAVAAGSYFSMALRSDGTVSAWGQNSSGQCNVPLGLSNVTAIAAGQSHAIAAREDGTVSVWGDNTYGQIDGAVGVSNVVGVQAQLDFNVALKSDGTIAEWPPTTPPIAPPGLANVAAVAVGHTGLYALKNDGTVAAFSYANSNPPPVGLTNVAAISSCAGLPRASALAGYIAPFIYQQPARRNAGGTETLTLRARAIGSLPLSYQWQHEGTNIPGATGAALRLSNLHSAQAGDYAVVVSNAFGTATSATAVVTVTPLLSQPTRGANGFSVRVLTLNSRTYLFEYTDSLVAPVWLPLLRFIGEGTAQMVTDTNSLAPQRFYRVTQLSPACASGRANLVSWWRAEKNATDAVGTNHGTLAGNVAFAPGVAGQAFVFDGTNDGVQLGQPASLQLQDFTIEAWVKRSDPSLTTVTGESGGSLFGWNTGGYGFGIYNDGRVNLTKIGVSVVNTAPVLVDLAWHHVAVTKVGSAVTFYVDGVAYPVSPYDPGFVFSGSAAIGARGDLTHSFLGQLDEMSVYARALSAEEIQAIYMAGSSGKCLVP